MSLAEDALTSDELRQRAADLEHASAASKSTSRWDHEYEDGSTVTGTSVNGEPAEFTTTPAPE